MPVVKDERTAIEKLGDLSIAHVRLWAGDVPPERSDGWQLGDWHCACGWFGNHDWEGYAAHLEEVIRLASEPRP